MKWSGEKVWGEGSYIVRAPRKCTPVQQPRTQALSSTLLAGENTLAGAGHVTHTKLIAYQGDGKVSGLILHVSTSALHTSIARSGRLNNHLSESYILQNTY